MTTHIETLIIGAGQAGLALSRCLTDRGVEHVLLERGRVAERWRSERWDSFRLLTPNWHTRLPGHRYTGPDPDGFMAGTQVVGMFEDYARSFAAPVQTGVTVTSVRPATPGWAVHTAQGIYRARNVVVATGHQDRPQVPALAGRLGVTQLHSRHYRNPRQLPDGAVLVVGAGPSGQQIALELARSGRRTLLAVGRHRWLPRRYRGHDAFWWMDRMGLMERTVDSLPDPAAARAGGAAVLGGGRDDLHLHRLMAHGVEPVGRLVDVDGHRLAFAGDLARTVAEADAHAERFRAAVDAFAAAHRILAPEEPTVAPCWTVDAPHKLDVRAAGISAVVWATGFRRDYGWLHAPVFDAGGEPVHKRGVTAAPGLFFLGLRWQHQRSSHFIDGVGRDAAYLAERIAPARRIAWATPALI